MSKERFNVRVYGLIVNEQGEVLVSDEIIGGKAFTKFPGGGLEHGEGTISCLERECREEIDREVEVLDHFYTTDFYQASSYSKSDQLISIYYHARLQDGWVLDTTEKPFDFPKQEEGAQVFRWISLSRLTEDQFQFPVDKRVAEMLRLAAVGKRN